jgi:hypothetical protein
MNKKHRRRSLPPFVPLFKTTLDTPAWKATSHGARSLYVALKRFWNAKTDNNGRIYLSTRDAAAEIGSDRTEVMQWYYELQHYGFIAKTTEGRRGNGGFAPHWRLTEIGFNGAAPTLDFIKWDGTLFRPRRRLSREPKNRLKVGKASHPGRERLAIVETAKRPPGGRERLAIVLPPRWWGKASHTNSTTPCPAGPVLPPASCCTAQPGQRRITKVGNGSRAVYVEHDDERCYQFREDGQNWQPCQVTPTATIPSSASYFPSTWVVS